MADAEREERQSRARERVRKLMAIYNRHPDTEEGRSAQAKALQLRQQYGLDGPTGDAFLDRLQQEADRRAGKAPEPPKPKFSRHAFETMAGAFRKQYPGTDDEDYTKYTKGRVVNKEDD